MKKLRTLALEIFIHLSNHIGLYPEKYQDHIVHVTPLIQGLLARLVNLAINHQATIEEQPGYVRGSAALHDRGCGYETIGIKPYEARAKLEEHINDPEMARILRPLVEEKLQDNFFLDLLAEENIAVPTDLHAQNLEVLGLILDIEAPMPIVGTDYEIAHPIILQALAYALNKPLCLWKKAEGDGGDLLSYAAYTPPVKAGQPFAPRVDMLLDHSKKNPRFLPLELIGYQGYPQGTASIHPYIPAKHTRAKLCDYRGSWISMVHSCRIACAPENSCALIGRIHSRTRS